ncbi:hypothetical protein VTN49DRAFT_8026 [Thermomyces lanuginosus]|uniref:uncharacterized protein n=1 Tax=Thermomyces lanuginosus TaxID=5541 RepID=UPI0037433BE0
MNTPETVVSTTPGGVGPASSTLFVYFVPGRHSVIYLYLPPRDGFNGIACCDFDISPPIVAAALILTVNGWVRCFAFECESSTGLSRATVTTTKTHDNLIGNPSVKRRD